MAKKGTYVSHDTRVRGNRCWKEFQEEFLEFKNDAYQRYQKNQMAN